MPRFGRRSSERLETCEEDLIILMYDVVQVYDCSVLCGHRGEEEQNQAYASGNSTLSFPLSKHNTHPSRAVDVVPYPVDWDDLYRFHELAGVVKAKAHTRGIDIEWGGDWKTFKDYPHWQLGG